MALTITDLSDYLTFSIKVKDAGNAIRTIGGYLTPHADDNLVNEVQDNFGTFLSNIEAVTSCKIEYAELFSVSGWTWVSDKTPETVQYATVDNVMVLNFERANPLKPGLKLNANFPLYAYQVTEASLNFPNMGSPNFGNADMAEIADYLEKRLTVRYSGNGQLYHGFTSIQKDSGGVSVGELIDDV